MDIRFTCEGIRVKKKKVIFQGGGGENIPADGDTRLGGIHGLIKNSLRPQQIISKEGNLRPRGVTKECKRSHLPMPELSCQWWLSSEYTLQD